MYLVPRKHSFNRGPLAVWRLSSLPVSAKTQLLVMPVLSLAKTGTRNEAAKAHAAQTAGIRVMLQAHSGLRDSI
jgi:hypothetical protein